MTRHVTSQEIIYVVLEYVGIAIYLFLIFHCILHSINYTLLILCVVAILNNINESVLLFHFDYEVPEHASGKTSCTVSAVFEHLLPPILIFLGVCMALNVWLLIVRRTGHSDRQVLPWFCLFSFGVPLITTAIMLILLRNEPHFSAYPRRYYCDIKNSHVTIGTYVIPMFVGAVAGISLTLHTVIFLILHYFKVRRTINSGALFTPVVGISHCVRLFIFSLTFGVIALLALMQRLVSEPATDNNQSLDVTSDFSGSLSAYFIFAIFGTTRDSLRTFLFLVCLCRRQSITEGHHHHRHRAEIPYVNSSDDLSITPRDDMSLE